MINLFHNTQVILANSLRLAVIWLHNQSSWTEGRTLFTMEEYLGKPWLYQPGDFIWVNNMDAYFDSIMFRTDLLAAFSGHHGTSRVIRCKDPALEEKIFRCESPDVKPSINRWWDISLDKAMKPRDVEYYIPTHLLKVWDFLDPRVQYYIYRTAALNINPMDNQKES